MRKEASAEQWKNLYETATRLGEMKPWEKFWDMDLIAIRYGEDSDAEIVFCAILGKGDGDCGVLVFEGLDGLNDYMMFLTADQMNIRREYMMHEENLLACYWGARDDLTNEQRKTIKELGYRYRGKHSWLYFMSYKTGYAPYNMEEEEVCRMTVYLQDLELALQKYIEDDMDIDFENGNMYLFIFSKDKKTWNYGKAEVPFDTYQVRELFLTDEELLSQLAAAPRCRTVLEAEVSVVPAIVKDKKYDRPANPGLALLCDAETGFMINCQMAEPQADLMAVLADCVVNYILENGAPEQILVSNEAVSAALNQICEICGIRLTILPCLEMTDEFLEQMGDFI